MASETAKKERVAKMVAAVKSYTTRSLDARLGPIEARILKLEASSAAEIASLRERNAELERQLDERGAHKLRAVE